MSPELKTAIAEALEIISPNWPLDRQIAVNPHWGLINQAFEDASVTVGRLTGSRFALDDNDYLRAWHAGDIAAPALLRALGERGASMTLYGAIASLQAPRPKSAGLPMPSDSLDEHAKPGADPRWCDTITQQISQYCAAYFDEHQADWHRGREGGLFRGWRSSLENDHALASLMQAPQIRERLKSLPAEADEAIAWSLNRLGVTPDHTQLFLRACLLRINGWASWCAYLSWEAGLRQSGDTSLHDLLAIRVCWEALLIDVTLETGAPLVVWRKTWLQASDVAKSQRNPVELIWQRAHEISFQNRLVRLLTADFGNRRVPSPNARSSAQVVFCIDVRSERFRRALEAVDPTLETLGFAGFFGLPIDYTSMGTATSRPQLPGLLAPVLAVTDTTGDTTEDGVITARRKNRLRAQGIWQLFARMPSGAFAWVETLGLGYAFAMLRRHWLSQADSPEAAGLTTAEVHRLRPHLCLDDADALGHKADLVAKALQAMSLSKHFARLLVFVGHGSQSANNPQAAALDCGACGGHSGEVNARLLARLCNELSVREALSCRGINIPPDTVAVAALHNTTTDEVTLFELEQVPASHDPDLARLQAGLIEAGHKTRAERAPDLGLATPKQDEQSLLRAFRRRARDWAETRPEWGLADNAAFIVAPRSRTRGLDLAGRSFLHDYLWEDDHSGTVLELIMTAPMVVAHWINMQYFASTVDPVRYGSGNKVLHNVVCGRIGVFEGNTGDLRIGLSRQSLHDGERWRHTPLRLSVFIDAPQAMIDAVVAKHQTVRHLVEHQWLYLFRFADAGIEWRREGVWQAWVLD